MREGQLLTAWYEAHQELRTYLETWTYIEQARQMASSAIGHWVQEAADGEQPSTGPYVALYASATAVANLVMYANDSIPLTNAAAAIPINATLLPYQLSKIHTDIWRAGQLLSWDRKTIHRVAMGACRTWPVTAGGWSELGSEPLGKLVPPLVRRAVDVLSNHRCLDCAICAEAAVRWEEADRRTEEWFTGARLRRDGEACPTEERSPSP